MSVAYAADSGAQVLPDKRDAAFADRLELPLINAASVEAPRLASSGAYASDDDVAWGNLSGQSKPSNPLTTTGGQQ